jgi:hypothetical protein
MLLNVQERLVLLNLLPAEGDLTTLRIVRELESAIGFTEAEHSVLQFKKEAEQVSWQPGVNPVDIPIGHRAFALLSEQFKALDERKKLTLGQLPLYERFIAIAEEPVA